MLYENSITGIPTQLGRLTALTTLDMYTNNIGGSIPTELGLMTALTKLCVCSTRRGLPLRVRR